MASETSSHGPGSGMPQHKSMAQGSGIMAEQTFGIGKLPGSDPIKSPNTPDVMSKQLGEGERAVGKSIPMGPNSMDASRNPDHGPHGHDKSKMDAMDRGYRR